ncbi:MAG: rhomboid family intrarane serine protease [Frankiales bacterium]|nr:rhomboid family intrarane serine protease [Frankiales bacterium]
MVLPVHDTNPTRRPGYLTWLLIAINVVVFVASPVARHVAGGTSLEQQCRTLAYFDHYAAVPDELVHNRPEPTAHVYVDGGCPRVAAPFHKQPFVSVLTAMFLHGSWLHLLGNMLFLFVFGNNVEDRLGRIRYLLFYLGIGFAATYGFALVQPSSETPLVGASGAIAGVLGGYFVLFPRAKVLSLLTFFFFLPLRLPAWLVLGSWFVLQYISLRANQAGSGSGVAYLAHVIGFVLGAALCWPLRGQRRRLA